MNEQIKQEILAPENAKQTAKALLIENVNENGLINLSYEVIYNKNAILCLQLYEEGCGAYCSSGETYFNFDLKTGKTIGIADLIREEMLDSFRTIVFNDKVKALQEYKIEEMNIFKQGGIDSATYDWALEQVENNCIKTIALENFSLSNSNIEIIDRCEFPHAIRSQQPVYELKYSYQFLQPFLKLKFKNILLK